MNRQPESSITRHLLESDHQINVETAFQIAYATPNADATQVCRSLWQLTTSPPSLCVQLKLSVTLKIPW